MSWMRRSIAGLALMLGLSACQVTVTYTTRLADDGSGTFSVAMTLDEEAAKQASPRAVSGFFETLQERGWTVERTEPDGGLRLEATQPFTDPEDFGDVLDEVRSTRESADSGEFGDIGLTMSIEQERGTVQTVSGFSGDIDFGSLNELPPEALAELRRAVIYEIIADLPGDARVSEGEAVLDEQGRVVWSPLLGEPMSFAATSTVREPTLFIGLLLGGAALGLAALAGMVRHRRKSRRRAQPVGGMRIEHSSVDAVDVAAFDASTFDVEAAAARIQRQQRSQPSLDEFEFPRTQPPIEPIDALLDGPGPTAMEPRGSSTGAEPSVPSTGAEPPASAS